MKVLLHFGLEHRTELKKKKKLLFFLGQLCRLTM